MERLEDIERYREIKKQEVLLQIINDENINDKKEFIEDSFALIDHVFNKMRNNEMMK